MFRKRRCDEMTVEELEETVCCCECDSLYGEALYEYEGKVYCARCLLEEMEKHGNGSLQIAKTYYYDGSVIGDNDEDEAVRSLIAYGLEIKEVRGNG
jgi:hypothetical protein